ncbi:MAG: DNA polymerase III subunit beta [Bacteroidales bacterium]|nr:DNA polymerase III subunit beta [Bacteroidales bacterium]
MKFIASSSALSSRLQAISKVLSPKNALPVLDNFLFDIQDNRLTVTASDAETTMVTTMDLIESDKSGVFAISAKNMLDAFKEISEQPVTIEVNEQSMAVRIDYQNGSFNFVALPGDEYPTMKPMDKPTGSLSISPAALLKGISSTVFASADDELRPVMNGVVLDITGKDLTFVASDAHKLVRLTNTAFHGDNMEPDSHYMLILRKKPINVLKSILGREEGDAHFIFDENRAIIQLGDYKISTLLIEGRFPNYQAVIPQNNPYTIWVDRLSILNALKRVSICSDQSNGLVRLDIRDNQMTISAQNSDFSTSAQEAVSCQYGDAALLIGFKAQFLIDIMSNIVTQDVVIKLADPAHAGLIMPSENDENEDLLMLLMPMMIKA